MMKLDAYKSLVKRLFTHSEKRRLDIQHLTPSAVLIPMFDKDGTVNVLFTKRTDRVQHHKRQISFPGGARDPQDESLEQTALRETEEEVGIKAMDVEVIAELDDMTTPTGFHVTPFVGIYPHPYVYAVNAQEINQLIEVPLEHLLSRQNYRKGFRQLGHKLYEIHYYDYEEHTIWGVTGYILYNFLERLLEGLQGFNGA